jgi:hypothetical protein
MLGKHGRVALGVSALALPFGGGRFRIAALHSEPIGFRFGLGARLRRLVQALLFGNALPQEYAGTGFRDRA